MIIQVIFGDFFHFAQIIKKKKLYLFNYFVIPQKNYVEMKTTFDYMC